MPGGESALEGVLELGPCQVFLELMVVQVKELSSGYAGRHYDSFLDWSWREEVDLLLDDKQPVLGDAGVPGVLPDLTENVADLGSLMATLQAALELYTDFQASWCRSL